MAKDFPKRADNYSQWYNDLVIKEINYPSGKPAFTFVDTSKNENI